MAKKRPVKPPGQRRRRKPDPPPPPGTLRQRLAVPELRAAIARADIVLGVSIHNQEDRSVFYGKATMERAIATGRSKELLLVQVPIDFETLDLEVLYAFCKFEKGSCDYPSREASDLPDIDTLFN